MAPAQHQQGVVHAKTHLPMCNVNMGHINVPNSTRHSPLLCAFGLTLKKRSMIVLATPLGYSLHI